MSASTPTAEPPSPMPLPVAMFFVKSELDAIVLGYHCGGLTVCLCSPFRCIWSLARQSCPLCRVPFQSFDVRKIHMDRCSRPGSPERTSRPGSPDSDYNEFSSEARELHNRITDIVLFGGLKTTELRDFLEEVKGWLTTQPSDDVRCAAAPSCM